MGADHAHPSHLKELRNTPNPTSKHDRSFLSFCRHCILVVKFDFCDLLKYKHCMSRDKV